MPSRPSRGSLRSCRPHRDRTVRERAGRRPSPRRALPPRPPPDRRRQTTQVFSARDPPQRSMSLRRAMVPKILSRALTDGGERWRAAGRACSIRADDHHGKSIRDERICLYAEAAPGPDIQFGRHQSVTTRPRRSSYWRASRRRRCRLTCNSGSRQLSNRRLAGKRGPKWRDSVTPRFRGTPSGGDGLH